jgi:hypothetical protein
VVGRASSNKCHNILLLFLIYFKGIANLIIPLQRCNDPASGRKCKHVTFRNHGPDNLESMHVMFGNAHVTGASASTPADLSDNPSSSSSAHDTRILNHALTNFGDEFPMPPACTNIMNIEQFI